MITDKKEIKFSEGVVTTALLDGKPVEVKNYLSNVEQEILIGIYINELFDSERQDQIFNRLRAENALIINVLDMCTNLLLTKNDESGNLIAVFTIDSVFVNMSFWENVKKSIGNYDDFRKRLDMVVEEINETRRLENSLPKVVKDGYTKLMSLLEGLLSADFSEDKINELRTLAKDLEASPVLSAAIKAFSPSEKSVATNQAAPEKKSRKKKA